MNLVVVGTSWITEHFIDATVAVPDLVFYGTMSRNAEKAEAINKKWHGKMVYTSIEEVCADPMVDIVYIASPNALHFPQAKHVLLAQKHAIVEKPITSNPKQLQELWDIRQKGSAMLFEAITTLHMPKLKTIQSLLPSAGPIRVVSTEFNQYSSRYDKYLNKEVTNVFDLNYSGGALYDLGIYNVYFTLACFGKPKSVTYKPNLGFNGIDLSGICTMHYDNMVATAIFGKDNRGENRSMIAGEKGFIRISGAISTLSLVEASINDQPLLIDDHHYQNGMGHEAEAFIQCIKNGDIESEKAWISLAMDVSDVLYQARQDANIVFPQDNE